MSTKNIPLQEGFTQVCIMSGTVLDDPNELVEFMQRELNTRVQYLEEIETLPDYANGEPVEDTGGRNDVFFAVHTDDIPAFAVPRIQMGVRWIEDAISSTNGGNKLYPKRVKEYCSWKA